MSLFPSNSDQANRITPTAYYPGSDSKAIRNDTNQSQLDLVGPILRRKFLIGLFMFLGAILGFLYCQQLPLEYESFARLMITSQSPPIIDGAIARAQEVSIPKHCRLLTSQLVLSNASQSGDFKNLKTFKDSDDVIGTLLGKVLVVEYSKKENDQTLQVSAVGEVPEELPIIINKILDSYTNEIRKDSQNSGDENVRLVGRLRDQLIEEKNDAEQRYLEILRKLNLPDVEKGGVPTNPFVIDLESLQNQRSQLIAKIRDMEGRLQIAEQAINSNDPTQINFLATEANRFMGVEVTTVESLTEKALRRQNQSHAISLYQNHVFQLQKVLEQQLARREGFSRTMGSKHPTMRLTENQISSTRRLLDEAETALITATNGVSVEEKTQEEILAEMASRNRQVIAVYYHMLKGESTRLSGNLEEMDKDLQTLENKAKSISADINELALLKSRIAEKQQGLEDVMKRLSEINVVATNFNDTKVRVIDPPSEAAQVGPSMLTNLAIGVLGGLFVGAGLALLIDLSDQTYRNPAEIYQKLGVPVIAKIPPIRSSAKTKKGAKTTLTTLANPSATASEAIRAARTTLFFNAQTAGAKVFLFTSPSPGDGKSTATANLAVSIAQTGKSVVLVDADLRRPRVHAYFGEHNEPGLLQAVSGTTELRECLRPFSLQDGLTLLTSGGRPKNPGEVVTSHEFSALIELLREQFDFVLVDSPPILPVSDAAVIASYVDMVYLVLRIRKGCVVTSSKAKEKLDMVNARLGGVIVNGVDDNPHYNEYGSYGYNYGYGATYGKGAYYENRNSEYREKIGTTI